MPAKKPSPLTPFQLSRVTSESCAPPGPASSSKQRGFFTFKAFGFEFPLPLTAAYVLAAIVVTGVGYKVYSLVYGDPEKLIVSLKDVNEQLHAEVEEYSRHVMEEPAKHEMFEDKDGKLTIRVYADHCVMIQRQTLLGGVKTKLVMDLARASAAPRSQIHPQPVPWSVIPTVLAQSACQRGCMNPHPGQFQWWYGQKNGEWVEVWRKWPEGCQHVQMFNPTRGIWDTNPDGTARVRWTCCTH